LDFCSGRKGYAAFQKDPYPEKTAAMKIEIRNLSPHPLPAYQTLGSAGLDITAWLNETITIRPLERALIPTGLSLSIPAGYEGQVRPRSGLAFRHGLTILNSPGTIDSDYRGELKVLLVNLSNEDFLIEDGMRIAQLVIAKHETIEWEAVETLAQTVRGKGGYGSTG
jgi:dUTP pyrophosphatase